MQENGIYDDSWPYDDDDPDLKEELDDNGYHEIDEVEEEEMFWSSQDEE